MHCHRPEHVIDRLGRGFEVTRAGRDEDHGAHRRRQLVGPVDVDGHRGGLAGVRRAVLEGGVAATNERGGHVRTEVYD